MADRAEFLTVREVMDLLRLGRTTVYTQARQFLATGGTEGIPCRKFGRSLRFPAVEIRRYAGLPTGAPPPAPAGSPRPNSTPASNERRPAPTRPTARPHSTATSQSRRRTASTHRDDKIVQPALPFTD